jgi:hypothetical protein
MAIFSKKHNAKKPDEQPKVIAENAQEEKAGEEPSAETPAKEASSAEAPAQDAEQAAEDTKGIPAEPPVSPVTQPEPSQEVEPEALTPPVAPIEHRFGIEDAIQLMRSLPADPNMSLVVRVVRVTLGAVHVSVEEIVQDALRKEAEIKDRIGSLEAQISDLEKQLANLRREIGTQQADLKETVNVRERLHLADQYPGPRSIPPPISTAIRTTPSKPFTS